MEKVIDKIQKLLALAGNNASQAQAEEAMKKAKELAVRHQLDISTLSAASPNKGMDVDKKGLVPDRIDPRAIEYNYVATALINCFDARCIKHTRSPSFGTFSEGREIEFVFVAEKTDLVIINYCWTWLRSAYQKAFTQFLRKNNIHMRYWTLEKRHAFYFGMTHGITEANKKAVQDLSASDKGKYAIVLADKQEEIAKYVKALFPNIDNRGSVTFRVDPEQQSTLQAGYRAGMEIKLNNALQ